MKKVVKSLLNKNITSIIRGLLLGSIMGIVFLSWDVLPSCAEEKLSFSGITEPIKDVKLSMSIEGRISTIFFKQGAHVEKGQSILELDKKFEVLEAERRKLIWESKAELEAARARELLFKTQLKSAQDLFERAKGISKEKLEEKQLEHKLSLAEIKRLEIEEERQRIEYDMALEALRKKTLDSPLDGVIIKLFYKEGESNEEQQPLVHMVDTSKSRFVCHIEEKYGRTLKKGQSVDLKIKSGSGLIKKKGIVVFLSPVVDSASGLQEVKAEFDNQDGAVRPGVSGFLLLESP